MAVVYSLKSGEHVSRFGTVYRATDLDVIVLFNDDISLESFKANVLEYTEGSDSRILKRQIFTTDKARACNCKAESNEVLIAYGNAPSTLGKLLRACDVDYQWIIDTPELCPSLDVSYDHREGFDKIAIYSKRMSQYEVN